MNNELVEIKNEVPVTTSLKIHEYFEKRHDNVIADIKKLIDGLIAIGCKNEGKMNSLEFKEIQRYFIKGKKDGKRGRNNEMYYVTQDGFNLLVMGYEGVKALEYKLAFIEEFNRRGSELEALKNGEYLLRQQAAREMYMPKYRSAMSAIERLITYAETFGVRKSYFTGKVDNIYARINGAANKAAGVVKGTRPDATPDQSTHLKNICRDIERTVDAGIASKAHWAAILQSILDAIDVYGERYVRGGETPTIEAPPEAPKLEPQKIETPKRQTRRRSERSGWTRRSASKIIELKPWAPHGDAEYDFEEAD